MVGDTDLRPTEVAPTPPSEQLFGSSLRSLPSNVCARDPQTFEVFRNNTTAVEVIVKQINLSKNSKTRKFNIGNGMETVKDDKILQEEIKSLKIELDKANQEIESKRRGYTALIFELKKQLDGVNQRDLDKQSQNLALRLENEKLRILLDSKTNLIVKLKKELTSMKNVLKTAMKGFGVPHITDSAYGSDPGYIQFQKGLKKEVTQIRNEFEGAFMSYDKMRTRDIDISSLDEF